ncbi:MAG: NADH-quinone oxidoreductase subunit J [Candidatus Latescibacterota bacterium]|nr:MAG: NADH-quinone oxidoreductase subunit J [Candidatus Latescibacterota bacterium]
MSVAAFWILSALAVASAVISVTRRNPLSSALALVVSLVAVAGLFATLGAHFLFAIQLLVYAGAVMVLVIYVIMILNLRDRDMRALGVSRPRLVLAVLASVPVLVVLARVFSARAAVGFPPDPGGSQSIEKLAAALFTQYLFPFEVISVLLLAAMVGAVVLAMRKF